MPERASGGVRGETNEELYADPINGLLVEWRNAAANGHRLARQYLAGHREDRELAVRYEAEADAFSRAAEQLEAALSQRGDRV